MNNWAKEEAARIINAVGYKDTPVDVIAAALQQVADQCADEVEKVKLRNMRSPMEFELSQVDLISDLAKVVAAAKAVEAIRARFPREGA